jgi:hypothetical protein
MSPSVGTATVTLWPFQPLRLLREGKARNVQSLSRESLESLLESIESAIRVLQSRQEPRLRDVTARLERRRAEVLAALASKGAAGQSTDAGRGGSPSSTSAGGRGHPVRYPRRPDDRNQARQASH